MQFDLTAVPFSRFGSYMTFNSLPQWGLDGVTFRTMHGVFASWEVFRIDLLHDGRPMPYEIRATPTVLTLSAEGGRVEIRIPEPDVVSARGRGVGLRLYSAGGHDHYAFPAGDDRWQVNCAKNRTQYLLVPLRGGLVMDAPHHVHTQDKRDPQKAVRRPRVRADFVPDSRGGFEGVIHEFRTTAARRDWRMCSSKWRKVTDEVWRKWRGSVPLVQRRYARAAELAMYVNWASVVRPMGNLRRPTMLMSKNWMTQCWSWDHCFNAMALSYRNPDLAWDQWMTLFDHQDEHGCIPDSVSAPACVWNFCKPPIHGWTLSKMMKNRRLLTDQRARTAHRVLSRWTDWWMYERDYDGDGLPEYHHGNDSGWDNATVFDAGFPTTAPDLAAFLVAQMDVLARLAKRLGKGRGAQRWKRRADELLARLLDRLWTGERFTCRLAFSGQECPGEDSLLNCLPVVLGKRLPKAVRARLAAALEPDGKFVTDYGPATESPASPHYVPDGYWRGPIWGPEVVITVDGLARAGYRDQAREVARRYCDMCVTSGFAENFNALTGEPLRDKAYTWGSSAFLILAHEFLRR